MLPEQYTLSGIYSDHDWDRLEAADQESTEVLQIICNLHASGWTVMVRPLKLLFHGGL